jgi:hypothetical protein
MRTLTGKIILPSNSPSIIANHIQIEVRDVSFMDVPSQLVAQRQLDQVHLRPNGEVKFEMSIPEDKPGRTFSIRVHISAEGSGQVKPGDLLTTVSIPIPNTKILTPIEVPVVKV